MTRWNEAARGHAKPDATTVADAQAVASDQMRETLLAAPAALVPPVVSAVVLALALHATPVGGDIARLLAACLTLGGVTLAGTIALRGSSVEAAPSARAVAVATAAAFGAVGGALIFIAGGLGDARPLVVATLAAMMANAVLLGPLAPVSLAYTVPLVCGGAAGLLRDGDGWGATCAALLLAAFFAAMNGFERRQRRSAGTIIAALRAAEQARTLSSLLLDVEAGTSEWVWRSDAGHRLDQVPPEAVISLGLTADELEGVSLKSILRRPDELGPPPTASQAVLAALTARAPFRNQIVDVGTAERPVWWRITGKPVFTAAGDFVGFRGLGADITASRDAEARIAHLANYDAWTGLANRVRFQAHAAAECLAATGGRCGALLYLDLDGFKSVNDAFGHAAGDLVLKEVAHRLEAAAPRDTLVARLGGDEFAIWLRGATPARAEALADALIGALAIPFDLEAGQVEIGASIGIALTPRHGTDPDALLMRADLALYRAKADGKGLWRSFMEAYELELIERRKLEADLKLALARQEFELYYQPLTDLGSGEVVCFEALIRWHSPTRGLVSPADFIPAAEGSGLITAIGRWALIQACRDAARWPGDSHSAPRVAVNISPRHFRAAGFLGEVRLALQLGGLKPHRLEIEVTEGVFLDVSASATGNLQALRQLGVGIALDDFGTGYSSLSYLTDFPVDKIKIDRSFIQNLDREANRAVVDAILMLARRLSIKVTAEGVETAEQALALKLRRCDVIQGYLLGRPQPADEVAAMLSSVPAAFRKIIPEHLETPLGFALAMKKQAG